MNSYGVGPTALQALNDLAGANWATRRWFERAMLSQPACAERIDDDGVVLRGLVGLSGARAGWQARNYMDPVLIESPFPDIRTAAARFAAAVAAKLDPARAPEALAPVLAAMQDSRDPDQLWALAQTYTAVAAKLDPARAPKALALVLGAMQASRDPFELRALAQAYAAVAAKLDALHLGMGGQALRAKLHLANSESSFAAMANTLASTSQSLAWGQLAALIVDALRYPMSAGKPTNDLLDVMATKIAADPTAPKPARPWEHDLWAFLDWVKASLPDVDLERGPEIVPFPDLSALRAS